MGQPEPKACPSAAEADATLTLYSATQSAAKTLANIAAKTTIVHTAIFLSFDFFSSI
jgi:hypothetical protein